MAEMDDKVVVTKDLITDVADAIREEMDESDTYTLPTMVEKVHTLGQGGGANKFVVIIDFSVVGEVTSNKTWQEVYDYLTDYNLNIKDIPIYLIAKDEVGSNYDSANKMFYIKASATQVGTYQDSPEYHIVFEQNNAVIPSGSSDNPNIQQYTVKWNYMNLQINTRTFEAQQKLADTNTITVSGANANLKIKTNGGLASDSNGAYVNTGLIQRALTQSNSIKITNQGNTDKIEAIIKSNEGLNSDSNGLYVDKNTSLEIDSNNKLGVAGGLLSNIASSVMIGTSNGTSASFSDGGDDMPMKSCLVGIEPVQSGSGDPSPINERPISGWTECNLTNKDDLTNPTVTNTYNIDFVDGSSPLTVYGGTLDVVSGVLTVDRAMVDLGDLNYEFASAENRAYTTSLSSLIKKNEGGLNLLCTIFKATPNYTDISGGYDDLMWQSSSGNISFSKNDYTSAQEFKTGVTGAKLVYELATPTTYQLTPTEVKTLLGSNNIFADTGDVLNAEYTRDASIIINELLERVIALEQGGINGE